jgi:hypothetical protein
MALNPREPNLSSLFLLPSHPLAGWITLPGFKPEKVEYKVQKLEIKLDLPNLPYFLLSPFSLGIFNSSVFCLVGLLGFGSTRV